MQRATLEYNIYDKDFQQQRKVKRFGRVFIVGEKEIELFPVGVLAEIIDRTPQTITMWEKQGVFPRPMYKLPSGKCTRWYSKNQILGIQKIYKEVGPTKSRHFDKERFFSEVKRNFFIFDTRE
jgi:hypothetical protein